ncbi:WD40 repeat-like protein [Xylariaceae sp. FL0016]|nr:WD40 repeat-like protein [Xylariaceae sp. FL0016]
MSQLPAQPKSVLRGHRAQVHVTTFVRHNARLASGDAEGLVVLWDLTIMRPRAVWQAHTNAILGISDWGDGRIITEGRDNRLIVWKITAEDEAGLSTALPLDESAPERPQPWILHIVEINTMNFCSFAPCPAHTDPARDELLIAVPNTLATEAVDIYEIPSQRRQHTVHFGSKTEKKGMVMAVSLFWQDKSLVLVAGYESGLVAVARRRGSGSWDIIYKATPHTQPVLSLDVSPSKDYFLTSSADANIVKHPISQPGTPAVSVTTGNDKLSNDKNNIECASQIGATQSHSGIEAGSSSAPSTRSHGIPKKTGVPVETQPIKTINTKHSGQQSLRIRSDGKIFATAGWDSKVRVYSAKTMTELAVLKWHGVGCYAVAFASLGGRNTSESREEESPGTEDGSADTAKDKDVTVTTKPGELSVKDRRIKMAKEAHWLAAGSKDGKISLWDVY